MNKMYHDIRHIEKIGYAWEASTVTEDGHRISGYGFTAKQAVYDAHQKAKAYGSYYYPVMPTRKNIG